MREAAQTIVKKLRDPAPYWLVDPIAEMVLMPLQGQVEAARSPVTRKYIMDTASKGRQAAVNLRHVLSDPYIRALLIAFWPADDRGEIHETIAILLHRLQH